MNFNGYSLFNEVNNKLLRSYNRTNTYLNIKERHGPEVGKKYLKKFGKTDLISIYQMMVNMRIVGYEQVRRDIMRANNA